MSKSVVLTYYVLVSYFRGMFIGEDDDGNVEWVDHLEEAIIFTSEKSAEDFLQENFKKFAGKALYWKKIMQVEPIGEHHSETNSEQ